jgi:hypothetical protein
LTYLAALHKGLQPDTLVLDSPITLPPISGAPGSARSSQYWSPRNYGGRARGVMTLRRALEGSRNLVTARLLKGGIADNPKDSLYQVCDLAEEARLYPECLRLYPLRLNKKTARSTAMPIRSLFGSPEATAWPSISSARCSKAC